MCFNRPGPTLTETSLPFRCYGGGPYVGNQLVLSTALFPSSELLRYKDLRPCQPGPSHHGLVGISSRCRSGLDVHRATKERETRARRGVKRPELRGEEKTESKSDLSAGDPTMLNMSRGQDSAAVPPVTLEFGEYPDHKKEISMCLEADKTRITPKTIGSSASSTRLADIGVPLLWRLLRDLTGSVGRLPQSDVLQ